MRPVPRSAKAAEAYYYERDPIFAPEGRGENSMWLGGGLAELGLQPGDRVNMEDFKKIIYGRTLDGVQAVRLGYNKGGAGEHRACTDICFSDPKEISLAEHVYSYKTEEIRVARAKALAAVSKEINDNYIYYRKTENKNTEVVHAPGQGVMAAFTHGLSREGDPDSHTHLLIMNMTKTPDGQWMATDNARLLRDQKYLQNLYHSVMAKELSPHFGIVSKGNGLYGVAGIDREVIDHYSKRHSIIQNRKAEIVRDGEIPHASAGQIDQSAWQDTRRGKDRNATLEKCQAKWDQENLEIGYDALKYEQQVHRGQEAARGAAHMTLRECCEVAIKDAVERESVFTVQSVARGAAMLAYGRHDAREAMAELKGMEREGTLVCVAAAEGKYSTPEMAATEKQIMDNVAAGQGKMDAIMSTKEAENFLRKFEAAKTAEIRKDGGSDKFVFSQGQRQLYMEVVAGRDQFVNARGVAGAGKTTVFEAITAAAASKGVNMMGLSQTGKAVQEFRGATGADARTVDSFLLAQGGQHGISQEGYKIDSIGTDGTEHVTRKDMRTGVEYRAEIRTDADGIRHYKDERGLEWCGQTEADGSGWRRDNRGNVSQYMRDGDIIVESRHNTRGAEYAWAEVERHFQRMADNKPGVYFTPAARAMRDPWKGLCHKFNHDLRATDRHFKRGLKGVWKLMKAVYKSFPDRREYVRDVPAHIRAKETGIYTLDEAATLGTNQMLSLQKSALANGSRMICIGDDSQHRAIAAGKPFAKMMELGGVEIRESQRQKTDYMRAVVASARDITEAKDGKTALAASEKTVSIMQGEGMIHEVSDRQARLAKAVDLYNKMGGSAADCHIITQTNADRHAINAMIRQERLARGELGDGITVSVREHLNLDPAASRYAGSFKDATGVHAWKDMAGLKKGEEAKIAGIDETRNSLTLLKQDGTLATINCGRSGHLLQAHRESRQDFAVGEQIIFLKNNKALGADAKGKGGAEVNNGQVGRITSIDRENGIISVTIGTDRDISKGKGVNTVFAAREYGHFAQADAITSHKSQGGTYDRVIDCGEAKRADPNAQYVNLSRARYGAAIVTDSIEAHTRTVARKQDKESTLDYGEEARSEKRQDAQQQGKDGQGKNERQPEKHGQEKAEKKHEREDFTLGREDFSLERENTRHRDQGMSMGR